MSKKEFSILAVLRVVCHPIFVTRSLADEVEKESLCKFMAGSQQLTNFASSTEIDRCKSDLRKQFPEIASEEIKKEMKCLSEFATIVTMNRDSFLYQGSLSEEDLQQVILDLKEGWLLRMSKKLGTTSYMVAPLLDQ